MCMECFDTEMCGWIICQSPSSVENELSKAQCNYTTAKKELLVAIIECLKQFRGILFGYSIDIWSDSKNLVYAATLSESQWVVR